MGKRELTPEGLGILVEALRGRGYQVIGPTVENDAIVLAELGSAADLPWGTGVELAAGRYRLRPREDNAAFAHSAGPQSWKRFLHPPREQLWAADRAEGFVPREPARSGGTAEPGPMAFFGVRPCDLRAIRILDQVLTGGRTPRPGTEADSGYGRRRSGLFIVAVECTEPGATCFCASMGCGPAADSGYDLALTEIFPYEGTHRFVVWPGSEIGREVLSEVGSSPAPPEAVDEAETAVAEAAEHMGRSMPAANLHDLLADNRESPRWDEIAARCLSCANCTLVCPTCFCTTTEDVGDLTGDHVERWQRWDSCFDLDFSYLHGGSVRTSTKSRYRQWMTHKLSSWHDQFGSSGCVGCGRCIAWCPVGIDITEEAHAFAGEGST